MSNSREASGNPESSAVATALDEGRLLLVLQPIVDAKTLATVSYEGLLRLRCEDRSIGSAAELIEVAERRGEIERIDSRVLEMGLALLAANPALNLSLNVSSITAHEASWIQHLRALSADTPGLTSRLTIEITETAMIRDFAKVGAFVDEVRALGCRVAIDDFGAGYTSFRHLKSLHVDVLKIDGTFISELPDDEPSRIIAGTMIEMARALGLVTVAEWVTNAAAAAFLRDAGVDYLQGYFYGEPKPVDELRHIAPARTG